MDPSTIKDKLHEHSKFKTKVAMSKKSEYNFGFNFTSTNVTLMARETVWLKTKQPLDRKIRTLHNLHSKI